MLFHEFLTDPGRFPNPADSEAAARGIAAWRDLVDGGEAAAAIVGDPAGEALLAGVFGGSPYLSRTMLREPGFAACVLTEGPDTALARALEALAAEAAAGAAGDRLARALRIARNRVSLAVALADIAGLWTVEQVTAALTRFAEQAIATATRALLATAAAEGKLSPPDPVRPDAGSGFFVLGMGKLGGGELNYSSDIDLIVLFDTERVPFDGGDIRRFFVGLTRDLVQLLERRTAEGYVFRTDLRLRPDPASTAPALSVSAAIAYYESVGQNWERAAMIKARAVAGDIDAGEAFLEAIRPFLWRKHLDFAAIQDIHSIKRQIQHHRGGGRIAVAGHNLKLGRGGIREIEFFAQTQQLIWGGRYPELRCRGTLETLSVLTGLDRIDASTESELAAAYRFLRRAEHRLQMVNDGQVHSLPESDEEIARFSAFLGYRDAATFVSDLTQHLQRVEHHYGDLFDESPALTAPIPEGGSLSFTGADDDPDTLRTLARLGFADPARIAGLIRGWHHGRIRATRSSRARELLTELVPWLVAAFGRTASPDAAFARFGDFLARLPAGVQVFSLMLANPDLLALIAEIMGMAPRLAETLARKPDLLDAVLTNDFYDALPEADGLARSLDAELSQARDFQDTLDAVRRWTHEMHFRAGVHLLRGVAPPAVVEHRMSDVADAALDFLRGRVEEEFARRHGRVAGAGLAVVGLGKIGSRELNFESDLDLVFVFGNPDRVERSDGERPLTPGHYHAQLCQRLITAVTTLTREGRLYEVDTRLRPHGTAGPITIDVAGFDHYYRGEAWTWELMALTRARVVSAPPDLAARIEESIQEVLAAPRDPDRLYSEVAGMRRRIAETHATDDRWLVKHARGGLVDIGFVAQALQLEHAARRPEILAQGTAEALRNLADAELLSAEDAEVLIGALRLQLDLQAVLRLTVADRFSPGEAPQSLKEALARVGEVPTFSALEDRLREAQQAAHDRFRALIDDRAGDPDIRDDPAKETEG